MEPCLLIYFRQYKLFQHRFCPIAKVNTCFIRNTERKVLNVLLSSCMFRKFTLENLRKIRIKSWFRFLIFIYTKMGFSLDYNLFKSFFGFNFDHFVLVSIMTSPDEWTEYYVLIFVYFPYCYTYWVPLSTYPYMVVLEIY